MDEYKLLKDLPGVKAGVIFTPSDMSDIPSHALAQKGDYYTPEKYWCPAFNSEEIKNTDWFEKVEERIELELTNMIKHISQSCEIPYINGIARKDKKTITKEQLSIMELALNEKIDREAIEKGLSDNHALLVNPSTDTAKITTCESDDNSIVIDSHLHSGIGVKCPDYIPDFRPGVRSDKHDDKFVLGVGSEMPKTYTKDQVIEVVFEWLNQPISTKSKHTINQQLIYMEELPINSFIEHINSK